jgi:hypothetical protein
MMSMNHHSSGCATFPIPLFVSTGDPRMFRTLPSPHRITILLSLAAISILLAACSVQPQMGGEFATVPAGRAYADGQEIYFSHTEASDPAIAEMLTDMMKSPVLLVPALAKVPAEALANVYVFENGPEGMGPLGFQPDVFNNPPGTPGYSPLRQIVLVRWNETAQARELRSESEVLEAEAAGELTTSLPGVVVNMPFMVWEGGKR